MAKIEFKSEVDGYKAGEQVEIGGGVADIYVNRRRVAEYVTPAQKEMKPVMTRDLFGPKDARRNTQNEEE